MPCNQGVWPLIASITGPNLCTRAKPGDREQLGTKRANDWPVMRVTRPAPRRNFPERRLGTSIDARCQCVERLMRAATGPKSVTKAFEADRVNLVEDRHHSLLNFTKNVVGNSGPHCTPPYLLVPRSAQPQFSRGHIFSPDTNRAEQACKTTARLLLHCEDWKQLSHPPKSHESFRR